MRFSKIFIVLLLVCCAFQSIARAQSQKGIASDGRDYYLGYLPPSIKCQAIKPFQGIFALVSSYYDNDVDVNYFDPQTGKEISSSTYHISAKNYQQILLDPYYMTPDPDGEVPEYKSCHIHAKYPISCQFYSTGPNSGGMYLGLPTGALGKTYVVATLPANPGVGAANSHHFQCNVDSSSSEFMIIAIKDNTKVTIVPNGTTRHGRIGTSSGVNSNGTPHPFTVNLSRGQTYLVKSMMDDPENDESGSIVEATEPVVVIAAEEGAYNGQTVSAGLGGDQRDLTLETMIPVDFWTSDGHASMPFMDSPPRADDDGSKGDMYKIFTYDPSATTVDFSIDQVSTQNRLVNRFQSPPPQFDNIETGICARSENGQKILVEQYDYRQMNTSEPFPAPSQMNVVPITRYRTSYMWAVPDDKNQVHKKRYINVIARQDQFAKIQIWINGKGPKPLVSLPSVGGNATIPTHPELQGRRFEIIPGCYYATADSAFIVYQYGYLGIDPDNDLGDNDDDDYYFGYAAACGQSFGIDGALNPSLQVDTTCYRWHVKIYDPVTIDHGISQIEILNDPNGVLKRKPNTDSGYVSHNVSFDPPNFTIVPGDTNAQADIIVNDPLHDADAWVWALNGAGNDTLMHLTYKAPSLALLPADSAQFLKVTIGTDTCTQFVFKNTAKAGGQTFTVEDASLIRNGQGFRVTGTIPALPVKLYPGDSVIIDLCFNAAQPATVYQDTLKITTDCPTALVHLLGSSTYPIINTEDYDFGAVLVGHTKCHPIQVRNEGEAPFTLTKQWILDNFAEFDFADTAMLPYLIQPHTNVELNFCYTPSKVGYDTTVQHWASNIPAPFTHQKKDFSILSGEGIQPALEWDRPVENFTTECDTIRTDRLFLNTRKASADLLLDSVAFRGPDVSELKIVKMQFPLPASLSPGDSMWVDVQFTPDLSKPISTRWQDRFDTLIAYDNDKIDPKVFFSVNVRHADLTLVSSPNIDFGLTTPGTTSGVQMVVITNPGTAPLVLDSLVIDNGAFTLQPKSGKLFDTIAPNGFDTFYVSATMSGEGTTNGNLRISGATGCAPEVVIPMTISTSFVQVQAVGQDYQRNYICTTKTDNVSITSSGSKSVRVLSAAIVDDPAYSGMSTQFAFDNGKQQLTLGDTLTRNQFFNIPVTYIPTVKADVKALVRFTVDTVGNQLSTGRWTMDVSVTGTGAQEHQTVSAERVTTNSTDPSYYIAKTDESFEVPVRLTESIADPVAANVRHVSFDFTYRRDLFRFEKINEVAGWVVVNKNPTPVSLGNDLEKVSIEVQPADQGVIGGIAEVAHVQLRLLVSHDTNSTFDVSNVQFTNDQNAALCYVLQTVVPGAFRPADFCGDDILRHYLQTGKVVFRIAAANPNPASQSVHVTLDVAQTDVPVTMELFNMLGEKVRTFSQGMLMQVGQSTAELDLQGIASGTYTLRVSSPSYIASQMILISK